MLFRDKKKKKEPKPAVGIKQGGGGIVPAIDAPRSAVNAGERVRHAMSGFRAAQEESGADQPVISVSRFATAKRS